MKIGIITYHFATNYGAVLQAYALQTYLISNGHEVEFINYTPINNKTKLMSQKRLTLNKVIKKLNTLRRISKFNGFRKKLKIGSTSYNTIQDLENGSLKYDAIVCGSDQIWNPLYSFGNDFPHAYFLNFSYAGKKVSYAPSFGTTTLNNSNKKKVKNCLKDFHMNSVRERSSLTMLKEIEIEPVYWVPDPTLLLKSSTYTDLLPTSNPQSLNYIFSYILHDDKKTAKKLIFRCQDTLSINDVYNVNAGVVLNQKGVKTRTVNPIKWLDKIKCAKFVITNSYHASIFSIIFNVPFVFISQTGEKKGMNERAQSLLDRLGIRARIIDPSHSENMSEVITQEINWDEVNNKLSEFKKEGEEFLLKALL